MHPNDNTTNHDKIESYTVLIFAISASCIILALLFHPIISFIVALIFSGLILFSIDKNFDRAETRIKVLENRILDLEKELKNTNTTS